MSVTKMKWIAVLLPAFFVGLFEIMRHELLHDISTLWGNLMVAFIAAGTSLIYYHGIFTLLQNLHGRLEEEKQEKAVLQERDRIARELHDSVSQALFFINIKAKEIEDALQDKKHQPLEEVKELRKAIKLTDADVRQHIFNLQMASQTNVDFATAIQSYMKNFQEQSGIQVELTLEGDFNTKLTDREKNQLIRIFQEVLWNTRKHAEAEQVQVSMVEENHQFAMTIQDNGKGFEAAKMMDQGTSFGLKILEERASTIGADFNVESGLGTGTSISVKLDLSKRRAREW